MAKHTQPDLIDVHPRTCIQDRRAKLAQTKGEMFDLLKDYREQIYVLNGYRESRLTRRLDKMLHELRCLIPELDPFDTTETV